ERLSVPVYVYVILPLHEEGIPSYYIPDHIICIGHCVHTDVVDTQLCRATQAAAGAGYTTRYHPNKTIFIRRIPVQQGQYWFPERRLEKLLPPQFYRRTNTA